jgi:hypothetical protein
MSVRRELQSIRRSLDSIIRALVRLAPALEAAATAPAGSAPARTGRKLRLSPARRASLKRQGQYMGYLRNLKPRQKSRVKSLRVAKGVGPAIELAKKLSRAAAA